MYKRFHAIAALTCSALLGAGITSPLYASDLETIVGLTADAAAANVLLILDTSGSMGSQVLVDHEQYNPLFDYAGPFDPFDENGTTPRIFYSLNDVNAINFLDESDVNTLTYVLPSSYVCEAGRTVLSEAGFYSDGHSQFVVTGDQGSWTFMNPAGAAPGDPQGQENITECAADEGVHGNGGAETYPIDVVPPDNPITVAPWTNDPNDTRRIDWASTGSMYTFFTPNFLNWIHVRANNPNTTPVVRTRLEIVQDVATKLISDLKTSYENRAGTLNLGLMRFSQNGSGGMVLSPVEDVTQNQAELTSGIAAMTSQGNTPLAETMLEAKHYYAGEGVIYGDTSTPVPSSTSSLQADGVTYESPIMASCQKNYIVLLTDGQPVGDFEADIDIRNLVGSCNGSCLDELSTYMHLTDLAPGPDIEGVQNIDTFVIGFFTDSPLLENTATGEVIYDDEGDPLPTPLNGYFLADDPSQLTNAFATIFNQVESDVSAFTAPAVSVNSLNRLTNRDTLYFTMFEPAQFGEPHWNGNLKAYKIGRVGGNGDITILDANGNQAVSDNGTFINGSRSVWSAVADNGAVSEGGMASRLDNDRNIYSNISSSSSLALAGNAISTDNEDVIGPLVGMTTGPELDELIAFARGLNENGESRKILGDPLHSEPLIITYEGGADDLLLIYGTNDGYLHAVNPSPSTDTEDLELFGFIPKELLPQLPILQANAPSDFPEANKAYGMDGPISAWIKGDDGDFIVNDGEQVFVYAAMRRGGSSYYALDVTNRTDPKLAFVIDPTTPGFKNLGQTWSSMSYAKIRIDDKDQDVVIFGGGYDANQDSNNGPDSAGNAIYIADAENGTFVWSAGGANSDATLELADMTHSIPSDVRIIDINQDGYVDRMYVGDTGGQVWRFDINNQEDSVADAITGGLLAQLGGTGASNERRFYSAPSVSRFIENGQVFLTLGLGSGYRAHPLATDNDDKFFVLRDNNVYGPALQDGEPVYGDTNADYLITIDELIELDISNSTTVDATGIPPGQFGNGWVFDLPNVGEKSLSPALTADSRIFFTTYSPETTTLSCQPTSAVGTGRLYGIDILTGLPNLYGDADNGEPVLNTTLGPTGIPPSPKLVFTEPDCDGCLPGEQGLFSEVSMLTGAQVDDVDLSSDPVRTYWFQTDDDGEE